MSVARVASRLANLIGRVEPFDVITLWDIIEHLPSPCATLSAAAELLEPGGHLVLTTGDASSAVARHSGLTL